MFLPHRKNKYFNVLYNVSHSTNLTVLTQCMYVNTAISILTLVVMPLLNSTTYIVLIQL